MVVVVVVVVVVCDFKSVYGVWCASGASIAAWYL